MRAFVALEIPETVSAVVERMVARARPQLPPARWVLTSGYHLTLLFLGEIASGSIPILRQRLAPVFEAHRSLIVQLGAGGTFPAGRPARVAWLGVATPEAIMELARDVRSSCAHLRQSPDDRPFSPHLTLARCRQPWSRAAVETWESIFPGPTAPPFPVYRGVLMRSTLSDVGPRYDVVAEFPLGAE